MTLRSVQLSWVVQNCLCRAYRRRSPWHGSEVGKAAKTSA